jgi:hypothetical protein
VALVVADPDVAVDDLVALLQPATVTPTSALAPTTPATAITDILIAPGPSLAKASPTCARTAARPAGKP